VGIHVQPGTSSGMYGAAHAVHRMESAADTCAFALCVSGFALHAFVCGPNATHHLWSPLVPFGVLCCSTYTDVDPYRLYKFDNVVSMQVAAWLPRALTRVRECNDALEHETRQSTKVAGAGMHVATFEVQRLQTRQRAARDGIEHALRAVQEVTLGEVAHLKALGRPHRGIVQILGAIMTLFANVPRSPLAEGIVTDGNGAPKAFDWKTCKRALLKKVAVFLAELRRFHTYIDAGVVPEENWTHLKRLFTSSSMFRPEFVAQVWVRAQALCEWVLAMEVFHTASMQLKATQARLEAAESRLNSAKQRAADRTRVVQARHQRLNGDLSSRLGRLQALQANTAPRQLKAAFTVLLPRPSLVEHLRSGACVHA